MNIYLATVSYRYMYKMSVTVPYYDTNTTV